MRQAGPAVALNVTTALLALAQQTLLGVSQSVSSVVTRGWLVACDGQHRDLTVTLDAPDPLGAVVLAAERKTAGITRAVLEAGALAGGADQELAARYRRFGAAVGVAGQLANDLLGLRPGPDGATDMTRGRLSIPIVFALSDISALALRACLNGRSAGEVVYPSLHARALAELEDSGAYRYAWTLLQEARREGAASLEEIARYRPVRGTLDRLLPTRGFNVDAPP